MLFLNLLILFKKDVVLKYFSNLQKYQSLKKQYFKYWISQNHLLFSWFFFFSPLIPHSESRWCLDLIGFIHMKLSPTWFISQLAISLSYLADSTKEFIAKRNHHICRRVDEINFIQDWMKCWPLFILLIAISN